MAKQEVNNLGEALSVFVQIAELAQKKGILSFDDAIIAKSAIDFVNELAAQAESQAPQTEIEQNFEPEVVASVEESKPRRKATRVSVEK